MDGGIEHLRLVFFFKEYLILCSTWAEYLGYKKILYKMINFYFSISFVDFLLFFFYISSYGIINFLSLETTIQNNISKQFNDGNRDGSSW